LGWVVGLLYILYFYYIAARNVREFGDLLVSSTLRKTPLLAVVVTFVLVICYVLYLGIEVLGRTAEVFIVILFIFGAAGNLFALVSGTVDFKHLLPFLENGWKPILTTAFPLLISFPFGEMIAFLMVLPYLNHPKQVKKVWLFAAIFSGIILSWTTALNIAVLSVDVMERATFPTLASVAKINLLDFIQRLDALVVFTLLITVFFKASIYLYCVVIGIVDLFKLKNHQQIIFPAGGALMVLSMVIASNFTEHTEEGFGIEMYFNHVPMLMVIPFFMMLVTMIRRHFQKKSISKQGDHS
jgi:spore germination protein KB